MYLINTIKEDRFFSRVAMQALYIATIICLSAARVMAEDNALIKKDDQVVVRVRSIKASDPVTLSAERSQCGAVHIDDALKDLRGKLESLHFHTFKMVSNDEFEVQLKKKQSIILTEKTVLSVRPLYMDAERVGMWIKWTDVSGRQVLLDTRMHFDSQESMVTGTDYKQDQGLILAINARKKDS